MRRDGATATLPEIKRTPSGALLLPRPERQRFAAHPQRVDAPAAPAPATPAPTAYGALGTRAPVAVPDPPPPPPPEANPPAAGAPHAPPFQPSRLERLGLMTAGVAHDFNNVLSVIMVCAGEIADATDDAEQRERAREISDAAERGAELSRRLLTSERIPEPESEPIAIDTAIVDALPIVKRTLGDDVEISLSSQGHLPHVRLAPGELQRMLVNLAANSRDAMPNGGSIAIRTGQVTIPPGDPVLGAGWYVRISFSDSGVGMSPDVARRAVQPYFTTKRGGGSGLGLATVQGLVRSRGGELRLSSAPGSGATVSLDLPAVTAAGESLSLAGGPPAQPTSSASTSNVPGRGPSTPLRDVRRFRGGTSP